MIVGAFVSCDSYASFVLCNLPHASITRQTHTNHESIVEYYNCFVTVTHSGKYVHCTALNLTPFFLSNFVLCKPQSQHTSVLALTALNPKALISAKR